MPGPTHPRRLRSALRLAAVAGLLALTACTPPPATPPAGAATPAEAVTGLARLLRADDLAGFAVAAVPPDLHARLEAGWRTGQTRWPLEELPLDEHLPALLATLAAPGAEARLQAQFRRQFAGAGKELSAAAVSLGVFGLEYVAREPAFSAEERDHYAQQIRALSRWGAQAPLADPARARAVIAALASAVRRSGLRGQADLARHGMDASLRRLGPVWRASKDGLARYGLDLDASLSSVQATLQRQTGDLAEVRLRYTLAGTPIDTLVAVQRVDGRWYLRDQLRNAEASLRPRPAPPARTATP